jgi:hypothetical protein
MHKKRERNALWITVVIHCDFGVGGVIHSPLPPFTLIFFVCFIKKQTKKNHVEKNCSNQQFFK